MIRKIALLVLSGACTAAQNRPVERATAYLEAGQDHEAEAALREASRTAADGLPRAEYLNASSALHIRRGQLQQAEEELLEAQRIAAPLAAAAELRPTLLHNLAAIEMRTARYAQALGHEQEAIREWTETLASDDPSRIRAEASMASLCYMMNRAPEAREHIQHAIEAAEHRYGPAHLMIASLLDSDAVILEKLKMGKQARRERARARQIRGATAASGGQSATWNVHEPAGEGVSLYSK